MSVSLWETNKAESAKRKDYICKEISSLKYISERAKNLRRFPVAHRIII